MHDRPSLLLSWLLTLLFAAVSVQAQTTPPTPKTVSLGQGYVIDIPSTWSRAPKEILSSAYHANVSTSLSDAFHLTGSRPTDLPYAIIEVMPYGGAFVNPTLAQQQQFAQQVVDYYATAFNPPSRADRPPLFKSAKATPMKFDAANSRFTFSVVVKYDMLNDLHIDVSGIVGPKFMITSTIWSDAPYHDANRQAMLAMRDSLRMGTVATPAAKPGVVLKRTAQVAIALAVLAVAVAQVYVLVRARRERREDAARFLT